MVWNKKKIHVGGIFCDLTKGFDCVNHDVLTAKFERCGIQESTLNWFKSYLSNIRQRTKLSINKDQFYYCTQEIVKQGVPQGSVLGLLRFITRGDPKITRILFKKIVYFSEHFQNVITLNILSLRINTLISLLFPSFKTVLELLQSDSLQCLRRFFSHLLLLTYLLHGAGSFLSS